MSEIVTPSSWQDYELIDSGEGEKIERFGKYIFIRPEPKALWKKTLSQPYWKSNDAFYQRTQTGGGRWHFQKKVEDSWIISWENLKFKIRPTGFKHMGIFPEQAVFWKIIKNKISQSDRQISVLNLFAYTGGNTLAASTKNSRVTHIDSSKEILTWGRENALLSGCEKNQIRWIPEDVVTFVKREVSRGNKYDVIIMDPPKFGRGNKNQVWKIEEDLPKLLDLSIKVLSENPLLFIVNTYSVSFSSITLNNLLSQTLKKYKGKLSNGELTLRNSSNQLLLPQSIFAIWEKI